MPLHSMPWVQGDPACGSPQFRGNFTVDQCTAATITICGLGYFELYLNGAKVSEDLFVPAWTDYEPRRDRRMAYPIHDTFAHRVLTLTYDIAPYLVQGENTLGVWLGNGWYNQRERNVEGDFHFGTPKLCFLVEWQGRDGTAGTFASGEHLLWRPSEIVYNNIYFGETHDLSRAQADWCQSGGGEGWEAARIAKAPESRLEPQVCPADRVIRTLMPTCIHREGNLARYDCGENITGHVLLRVPAGAGQEVVVTHSEQIEASRQALDYSSAGGDDQIQTARFLGGLQETLCHTRFTWQAFRYFEVVGEAEVVEVRVIHGDHAVTSSFSCSDPTLNWLYDAYVRTQLANLHSGVPSDCPHRERLGYTGDGQLVAPAAMLCLDVRSLYDKWIKDILDGQDPVSGHVQHTAPFYGGGGGPGGWGGAIWVIPWSYYLHYGDASMLLHTLPNILLWFDYMRSRSEGGLVVREEEGGWCLGDWCAPDLTLPEPYVNTYYYAKGLATILDAAKRLSLDVPMELSLWLAQAKEAITTAYFSQESGSFCGGVNGADAFAVDLGLGDLRTSANLVEKYRALGTFDTGIFGTDVLVDVLFRIGEGDLALTLLTADSATSFLHMKKAGATTLWETWSGADSHSHPMFGAVVRALFTHVLGIRQAEGTAGFTDVAVHPAKLRALAWAKGSIMTPQGRISVEVGPEGSVQHSVVLP